MLAPCEAESVAFGLFIEGGSRHERAAEAGISHFIEHMLFKGTPTRRPVDITRAIEGRGGNFNAMTGEECTCYYAHLPGEYLAEAVEILDVHRLPARVGEHLVEGVPVALPGGLLVLRRDALPEDLLQGGTVLHVGHLVHVGGGEQLPEPGDRAAREPSVLPEGEQAGLHPQEPDLQEGVQLLRVLPVHDLRGVGVPLPQLHGDAGGEVEAGAVAHGDLHGVRSVLERPSFVQ